MKGSIFQILIFSSWSAGLGYLIYDNNYRLFLKPGFEPLIWISLGITLIFLMSLIPLISLGKGLNQVQNQIWIKGLILILPLGFILSSGDHTLGSYALGKRTMAAPGQIKINETLPGKNLDLKKTISISALVKKFNQFKGKKVQVEGLFAQSIHNHEDLSAVFRYFITCCAADAQPVGVFLKRQSNGNLKNNDWVSVEGKVEMISLDGFQVIFMDVESIKSLPKPGKNAAYIYE